MNPLYAAMSMQDIPEEELKLLAEAIRGRTSTGGALATSTIEPVQSQGLVMQKMGQDLAGTIGDQNYRKEALKVQREGDEALLKRALVSAMGKGGKKDGSFYKASSSATQKYEEKAATATNIMGLLSTFKPEYTTSTPLLGGLEEWAGRNKFVPSTENMEEMAQWWSDWKGIYENVVRHDLFGSALTASEKEEWKKANINSNMGDNVIAGKIAKLKALTEKAAARSVRSAINKDWDPQYAIDEYEELVPEEAKQSRGGLDQWVRRTTGKFNNMDPLETDNPPVSGLSDDDLMTLLRERGLAK